MWIYRKVDRWVRKNVVGVRKPSENVKNIQERFIKIRWWEMSGMISKKEYKRMLQNLWGEINLIGYGGKRIEE